LIPSQFAERTKGTRLYFTENIRCRRNPKEVPKVRKSKLNPKVCLDHEGHEGAVAWLGDDFDPEFFDLERVNRQLRRIKE
jgi:hypothetical protein